jgi:beta-glucosidase
MSKNYKKRANTIVAQMTLDEKIAQLGSFWIYEIQTAGELDWRKAKNRLQNGIGQITRLAGASTFSPREAAKAANKLQKYLLEETRLKIPALIHEECCSGAMVLGGTTYPQMIGLASTFQPAFAEKMTVEIRQQLMAIGARQALGPVLDVAVDPRWGRVEETFGEDPMLVSHFGEAYIKGLQSGNLENGVTATGKHFVGHSHSQGGLNCAPVHIGMREIYNKLIAPFQAAIRDAGLASIMNAYPEIDGEVVGASRRILTDILRDELGFDGLVVSDYETLTMLHNFHFIAKDYTEAAAMALNAGIDVELPTAECYANPLKQALDQGKISIEFVDDAVSRHLSLKFELGLFENPYVDAGQVLEVFETPDQRQLAREIARKSMVLLKNDGILPLKKAIKRIAVIGPNADSARNLLGDYSYWAMSELVQQQAPSDHSFIKDKLGAAQAHEIEIVTILEGIKDAVSPSTEILFARGTDYLGEDLSGISEASDIAQDADAVILVLGDRSGLTPECTTGETRDSSMLKLPEVQEMLAKAVIETGKPVVLVLVNGRPYAIPWLAEKANAILEAWLPGEEGGHAVADVIFGDVNPGGKLPLTFPRAVGQLPLVYLSPPSGKKSNWYVNYTDSVVTPLYPFGHGLSYTNFEYDDLSILPRKATLGGVVEISFMLTNTGNISGEEVVQLYVHDAFASSPRPTKELKGYHRLMLLPGESKRITFQMKVDQCAFYNQDLNLVLEPGTIEVMVGSSSEDIRLYGGFEVVGPKEMEVKERVFHCPVFLE